jgi:hypothetical protein
MTSPSSVVMVAVADLDMDSPLFKACVPDKASHNN